MRLLAQASVLILLALFATSASSEDEQKSSEDEQKSLVTVQYPAMQDGGLLLKQWRELPDGVSKKIESEIVVGKRLGLSSTGAVQLIGVYNHPAGAEHGAKPSRLFHLRQTDLFGSRLFWSILVNPEEETFKVLFHIRESGNKNAAWVKLRDGW